MSWVIIFCSFLGAFCLLIGMLIGTTWERHSAAKDAEFDAELAASRADEEEQIRAASASFDAIREAGRRAWAIQQERDAAVELYPGQVEPASSSYGMWQVRGDPITTGEIAAITPRMDAFLEELFRVPYSADELWSGQ